MWPLKSIVLEKQALFWGFQHTFMVFPGEIDGKMFIFRVNLGMWPLKSIVLKKTTQNMHSQAPVASQHEKTNKVVWTCEDDWPPKRTSTYERPFTWEGNYLVSIVIVHTIKWQIYPEEVFYAKDLLPARVTI